MYPDRPPAGAGFIDRKLMNQACLKHHISVTRVVYIYTSFTVLTTRWLVGSWLCCKEDTDREFGRS